MFDFQKLEVYRKAKLFAKHTVIFIATNNFDRTINDQLRRASLSVMLNISESSSRFGNRDRRHFLVIARGSAFECVAILEHLNELEKVEDAVFIDFYNQLEEISKMLYSLIKKLS